MRRLVRGSVVFALACVVIGGCAMARSRPGSLKEEAPRGPALAAAPADDVAAPTAPAASAGGKTSARDEVSADGRVSAALPARPAATAEAAAAPPSRAVAKGAAGAGAVAQGDVGPGPVRAGEWDDNANYREFQRYMGMSSGQPIHRVDVSDRQFLVVRDADGRAVPRCNVTVRDDEGATVTLATTASGRAILFPHAEGLHARLATATASCEDGRAMARIALDKADAVVDLKLDTKRALPARRTVDLAFILDTTGSMGEEISAVKATIHKVAAALGQKDVALRIGLVEYKDRTDPFVTRVYDMTSDVGRFQSDVSRLSAAGGGDYPESVNEGLHVGLTRLEWSGDAVLKLAFLIGDAPPHLDYQEDADYAAEMKSASHRGIQVFTVAASGMDALGQIVWRQIAQYTGATNLFVLRGGAGPQSTGGGDPASSCGGTQTAYASGNLDELIVRKVERQLAAVDGDPLRIPGVGMDENAKPCAERVVYRQ
jgi:uncharacterized protein YegL